MQRGPEVKFPAFVRLFLPSVAVLAFVAVAACGGSAGQRLYRHGGCVKCHGVHLKGSHLAPSLKRLGERWAAEELGKFLVDPLGYKEMDARLKTLAKRYPAPMPVFTMADSDRKLLVEYLLEASAR